MVGTMRTREYLVMCGVLALLAPELARADSCLGASSVPSSNQQFKVEGQVDSQAKKWSYVLTDLKTGTSQTGALPGLPWHAHLFFFLGQDGCFAVLDASGGLRLEDRLRIYQADGTLRATLGIKDILNTDEQAKLRPTVNHIQWLKFNSGVNSYGTFISTRNAVSLTTLAGREVLISLADGKLVTTH